MDCRASSVDINGFGSALRTQKILVATGESPLIIAALNQKCFEVRGKFVLYQKLTTQFHAFLKKIGVWSMVIKKSTKRLDTPLCARDFNFRGLIIESISVYSVYSITVNLFFKGRIQMKIARI